MAVSPTSYFFGGLFGSALVVARRVARQRSCDEAMS